MDLKAVNHVITKCVHLRLFGSNEKFFQFSGLVFSFMNYRLDSVSGPHFVNLLWCGGFVGKFLFEGVGGDRGKLFYSFFFSLNCRFDVEAQLRLGFECECLARVKTVNYRRSIRR